jgi:hypothetical protein
MGIDDRSATAEEEEQAEISSRNLVAVAVDLAWLERELGTDEVHKLPRALWSASA